MTQNLAQDQFDIDCLRHIVADAETQRVSLAAAMIKVHALAIARSAPGQRGDALEIVRYAEELYPALPNQGAVRRIVDDHLAEMASHPRSRMAAAGLAEDIWKLFQRGRADASVSSSE